jgi:aryl-alcohol dehydrogenase-like predicted oxidoreductase
LTEANLAATERLQAFARERGRTLTELSFSWLAARPQVASVIAGASTPEQVEQNVKAVEWALSAEDVSEIIRLAGVSAPPAH